MKEDLPPIIHKIGFDFNWSNPILWSLDVSTEFMPINKLTWHFNYPFIWPIPDGHKAVTPQEVIDYPEKFPEEYMRTMKADLSHPIDIMYWKNKWLILDGLHRLMRLSISGEKIIKVRKIPRSAIPKIVKQ